MLKIAIVGCGKIADSHAHVIRRLSGCEIVAACDEEELMAVQFCERFGVKEYYADLHELLKRAKPDVVHITTPPQSHFALALACLRAGCHVFVEKPFTVWTEEAEELIAVAVASGLKVTVGHDGQFSHAARRLRELVRRGYLGGAPVHMESYYCYDLTDPAYAKAFLADKTHWVRALPGKLFQNIASHGLARIAEYLFDDKPEVVAHGRTSTRLAAMGEQGIVDELRVLVKAADGCTAYFTISSQMRPLLHEFRVFGPANGVILNEDHQTVMKCRGASYKSYAEKFIPPLASAWQSLGNVAFNARRFLANDFHMKAGLKNLLECFYASIVGDSPVPISYREILLTSRVMDAMCAQVAASNASYALTEAAPSGRDALGAIR